MMPPPYRLHWLWAVLLTLSGLPRVEAQQQSAREVENKIHALIAAMNAMDLHKLLASLHPRAVVTWQHGGVAHGREGVRRYWAGVFEGEKPPVRRLTTKLVSKGAPTFLGEATAVCHGVLFDHYELRAGGSLDLQVHWSATLQRAGAAWNIIALHFSVSPNDNGLLRRVQQLRWYACLGGAALGYVVAALWRRQRGRRAARLDAAPQSLS